MNNNNNVSSTTGMNGRPACCAVWCYSCCCETKIRYSYTAVRYEVRGASGVAWRGGGNQLVKAAKRTSRRALYVAS